MLNPLPYLPASLPQLIASRCLSQLCRAALLSALFPCYLPATDYPDQPDQREPFSINYAELPSLSLFPSLSLLSSLLSPCSPCPPSPALFLPPQIIQINLTSESPQPIVSGSALTFTYSVQWKPTPIQFARRFERYLDYNFFEHQARRARGGRGAALSLFFSGARTLLNALPASMHVHQNMPTPAPAVPHTLLHTSPPARPACHLAARG